MPNNRQVLVLVECDPMETRVAVLENGKVVDLEIETNRGLLKMSTKELSSPLSPELMPPLWMWVWKGTVSSMWLISFQAVLVFPRRKQRTVQKHNRGSQGRG